jgi:hypothetical protein
MLQGGVYAGAMLKRPRPDAQHPPGDSSGNVRALAHYLFALVVMTLYAGQV